MLNYRAAAAARVESQLCRSLLQSVEGLMFAATGWVRCFMDGCAEVRLVGITCCLCGEALVACTGPLEPRQARCWIAAGLQALKSSSAMPHHGESRVPRLVAGALCSSGAICKKGKF